MREPICPRERLRCIEIYGHWRCAGYHSGKYGIWDELINKGYPDHPKSEHNWLKVAQEFEDCRSVPNVLGATDGKHAIMQAPACSGSSFFN